MFQLNQARKVLFFIQVKLKKGKFWHLI